MSPHITVETIDAQSKVGSRELFPKEDEKRFADKMSKSAVQWIRVIRANLSEVKAPRHMPLK